MRPRLRGAPPEPGSDVPSAGLPRRHCARAGGGGTPAWCADGGIPFEELLSLSTEERLRLVLRSMLLYSQWYDLAGKVPAISRLVEDAAVR